MAAITDRLDTQEDVDLARAAQRHIAIALDRSSVINIAIVEDRYRYASAFADASAAVHRTSPSGGYA